MDGGIQFGNGHIRDRDETSTERLNNQDSPQHYNGLFQLFTPAMHVVYFSTVLNSREVGLNLFIMILLSKRWTNWLIVREIQTIHSNDSCKWFIQLIHSNDSFKQFIRTIHSNGSFKRFIQTIYSNYSFKQFIQTIHANDSFKWFIQTIHSNYSLKLFIQTIHSHDSFKWFIQTVSKDSFKRFIQLIHSNVSFKLLIQKIYWSFDQFTCWSINSIHWLIKLFAINQLFERWTCSSFIICQFKNQYSSG